MVSSESGLMFANHPSSIRHRQASKLKLSKLKMSNRRQRRTQASQLLISYYLQDKQSGLKVGLAASRSGGGISVHTTTNGGRASQPALKRLHCRRFPLPPGSPLASSQSASGHSLLGFSALPSVAESEQSHYSRYQFPPTLSFFLSFFLFCFFLLSFHSTQSLALLAAHRRPLASQPAATAPVGKPSRQRARARLFAEPTASRHNLARSVPLRQSARAQTTCCMGSAASARPGLPCSRQTAGWRPPSPHRIPSSAIASQAGRLTIDFHVPALP